MKTWAFRCSLCHKKFGTEKAVAQHAADYHKATRVSSITAVKRPPREADDDYESEADRQVERDIAAASRAFLVEGS